ncbi:thioredoxin family protein [Candidatus Peregrinibacteria bacterium]|nr:thioredoxin family protein [Candidatus Peregrinibacteria bacterium]MBI3815993.1 thioredoxin family protein [Candidatus Peregrinibacteria bacterium]
MVLINDNSAKLSIGDPMPPFSLKDIDGSIVDSKTPDSEILVVIFTCNHCPYAQAYEDRIVALAQEFEAKGVQFVLINSNDAKKYPNDSFDNMNIRAKEKGYFFPYCHDETQEVAKSFGALCTPHCFVFNRDRALQYKGRIDDNWKEPSGVHEHNLRDAIAALIQGKAPPTSEANAIGCSIKWK